MGKKGRPTKDWKKTPELELQWEQTKPRILQLLEEGWSKSVAFKKALLLEHSELYHLCYSFDREFKALISKYNQPRNRGFYEVLTSNQKEFKIRLKSKVESVNSDSDGSKNSN